MISTLSLLLFCFLSSTFSWVITDSQQIQTILDVHNQERTRLGYSPLTWDAGVAQSADKLGPNCGHLSWEQRQPYGENLIHTWGDAALTPISSFRNLFMMWANERNDFICGVPSGQSCRSMCGHYTQMIWPQTTTIGCAIIRCQSNYPLHINCHYNPAGNYQNQIPVTCDRFNGAGSTNGGSTNGGSTFRPPTPTPVTTSSTCRDVSNPGWRQSNGSPINCPQEAAWGRCNQPWAAAPFCARSCKRCTSGANEGDEIEESPQVDSENVGETPVPVSADVPGYAIGLLVIGSIIVTLIVALIVVVVKKN